LIECISNADRTLDGINIIAASPIDSISLVTDMIALAKVDNQFHITEKLYIKQIGKLLNFSDSDVNELIDA
jgi:hypothetical protein